MGCICSNHRVHWHFRKLWKLPTDVTEDNVEELISGDDFEAWINSEYAMKSQYEWQDLTVWVDAYWWTLFANAIGYILNAHIVGICVAPWATCYDYFNGDGKSLKYLSWTCSLTWHLLSVPVCIFWIVVAWYGLRSWSHQQVRLIWNMIGWSNLITFGKGLAEFIGILIATNKYNVKGELVDAPLWQIVFFWIYSLILLGIVAFGFYVQYKINVFLHPLDEDYRLVYPSSEEEIVSLVTRAYNNKMIVRCVGSQHSQKAAIWGDDNVNTIMMSLDNYRDIVSWDEENMRVTVEAGIILGKNELKSWSHYKNGLVKAVDQKGWALPDLGGIIKQAAGGFTMMGCAGGSLIHDYFDAIYSVRIVDGTGAIQEYTRPSDDNEDDPFWGVVVSMGLCGIVSQITYQCEKRFNIIGSQKTLTVKKFGEKGDTSQADGVGKVNFHAKSNDDPESVYAMFTKPENANYKVEYSRFYWYPQTSKSKSDPKDWIVLWKAHREVKGNEESKDKDEEEESNANPYAPGPDNEQKQYKDLYPKGRLKPKSYFEIAESPIASYMAQVLVHFMYNVFGASVDPKTHKVSDLLCSLISFLINLFVSPKENKGIANQIYGATWWQVLPMDQNPSEKKMPFEFTELWIDIEDTTKCINAIWEYFELDDNLDKMGTFAWEFYVAKSGNEWIRPAYKRNSFRVDILWFDIKTRIPYTFYNTFWEFLIEKGIDFRPHWGKWCPAGEQTFPTAKDPKNRGFKTWADYYKSVIPKWDNFLKLRKELDPNNIFLTDYWARMLNIENEIDVAKAVTREDQIHYLIQKKLGPFKAKMS